jgi:hypothetical protein
LQFAKGSSPEPDYPSIAYGFRLSSGRNSPRDHRERNHATAHFLRFRNPKAVITTDVILESLSEGVGARLWLLYGATGIIFLVIGSAIEHSIQYGVGRVPVESEVMERGPE